MPKWFIESVSSTEASPPTKEEMEKLVPPLPPGWEEIERYSGEGSIWVKLGHLSPDPGYSANKDLNVHLLIGPTPSGFKKSKHDFTADIRVTYIKDSELHLSDFDSSVLKTNEDLEKAKKFLKEAGENISKEDRASLEELLKQVNQFASMAREGKYLGEKARIIEGPEGETAITSVSIGRFVLDRSLIGADQALKQGNTRIHSVKCEKTWREHEPLQCRGKHDVSNCGACSCHSDGKLCSTLKTEGFIHKEEAENLLSLIFSQIKGEKPNTGLVEILRESGKIENPKEKFELEDDDMIKTDSKSSINIQDDSGDKISIGSKSKVKLNEYADIELLEGTAEIIFENIDALKSEGYSIKCRTPQAICGVRGTIFSLFTDKNFTTLTVVEGEVEFLDLNGNKEMVKENQVCVCSKEHGLQKPVTMPVNLKEQFKR